MNALLAVILLTYRESVRRKILLVLAIFCVGLIVSSAFFPAISPEARIKLVQAWTFQSITFFGILVAIFLAAVSIPADIENKRVFLILTKPVNRETIIFGRLIGFILTTALITGIMAIAGLGYIRMVSFFSPESGRALEINRRINPDEFYFRQHPAASADQSGGLLSGLYIISGVRPELEVTLEGGADNFVAYNFSRLSPDNFDRQVRAEIDMKAGEGAGRISSTIAVKVVNPTTKEEFSRKMDITYRRAAVFVFDREFIDRSGEVRLFFSRTNPGSYIKAGPASVVLLDPQAGFEWNFFVAFGIVFLQIVLVLVFCVACSSFLSGPVNIFLNMFLYFSGSGMKFIQGSLANMNLAMAEQIKRQNLAETAGQFHSHYESDMPLWLMRLSDSLLSLAIKIMPDFSRFDAWGNLLKGYSINLSEYAHLLGYIFVYAAIMLIIGMVAFRLRDIK